MSKLRQHTRIRKSFVLNLAICCISLLLAVIGAEVVMRLSKGNNPSTQKLYPQGLYCERHPLFGWIGKPHATGTISWSSPDMAPMHVAMNPEGFWDRSHQKAKLPGTKRILFLGDSFTIGYGVVQKDRFPDIVASRVSPSHEIINLGMWGYSTDQELLVFTEIGQAYEPDVVVISMFLDDLFCTHLVSVNEGRYIKPKFAISSEDKLVLSNVPVPDNNGSSLLLNMLRSRICVLRNRFAVGQEFAKRNWFSVFDKAYVKENGYYPSFRILEELHAMTQKNKMILLLVMIPYKDQLFENEIRAQGKGYAGIPPQRLDMRLPQKMVTFFCQEKGIPMIDMLPLFEKHGETEKLFFDRDLHWTKRGHEIAAHAIMDRLGTMGVL